jgi:hypothetical protein
MKRLKKILKWTGIVLGGLAAILLIANAWFVWTTDKRLEKQLQAIRDAGDPLTMADLARPPIPPEQNAATYLERAKPDFEAAETEWEPYWEWSRHYFESYSEGVLLRMSPEIQKNLQDFFDARPQLIPLLKQASECPDYQPQLDYTENRSQRDFVEKRLLPHVRGQRSLARVLDARSRWLVARGNYHEALQNDLMLFRLVRLFNRKPSSLVDNLVAQTIRGMAIFCTNEVLQMGLISKEDHEALEMELASQECSEGFCNAIKGERIFILSINFNFNPRQRSWFLRGYFNRIASDSLEGLNAVLKIAQQAKPFSETKQEINVVCAKNSWSQLLLPAIASTYKTDMRSTALIRCFRVLNAIQAHELDGGDAVPKLEELGLPPETTLDPFNGEPLHVKKLPEGWLVYSVGENGKDDGGKWDDMVKGDVGIGPCKPKTPSPETADSSAEK